MSEVGTEEWVDEWIAEFEFKLKEIASSDDSPVDWLNPDVQVTAVMPGAITAEI